jgi:D-sedoheptulose 7-phosphate isomerase
MSYSVPTSSVFFSAIAEHLSVIQALNEQSERFEEIAQSMTDAILDGKKIIWCGNGGSAADSQHLAAELVGRFRRERKGIPSIALTTDTSILTSVGNDYGYEHVFRRQVEALCVPGDVVVGISTSGNSKNVCLALDAATNIGATTIAFTGAKGGKMLEMASLSIRIASEDTARIQEGHILFGHMLCDWIESAICKHQANELERSAL